MSKSLVRTVTTSMVGNLFEWYDFALFGYFASIIGRLFFPSNNPTTELLSAFVMFAVGFLARPLGGIIFGYIGDRMGRKRALVLTILLMAIPTAIIGVLPTYAEIGVTASVLLVIMRILQGLSMGGNYGGSITFTAEHTDPSRRGFIASFAVTSCLLGILLGSATAAFATHFLSEQDLMTWGWRLPFLMGIVICVVGFYMRSRVPESPEYIAVKKAGEVQRLPFVEVFRSHWRILIPVVLVVMLHDLSFYMLFVFLPSYLSNFLTLPESTAITINSINLLMVSVVTIGAGALSDKIGRRTVLAISAVFFILGTYPLMKFLNGQHDMLTVLWVQTLMAIAVGGYFGPIPALMVEAFPTNIRFSAVTITSNISGPLFGGATPALLTWLIQQTGDSLVPAYYLTGAAVVTLVALMFVRAYHKVIPQEIGQMA